MPKPEPEPEPEPMFAGTSAHLEVVTSFFFGRSVTVSTHCTEQSVLQTTPRKMQEKMGDAGSKDKSVKKTNLLDQHSIKHLLDESVSEVKLHFSAPKWIVFARIEC